MKDTLKIITLMLLLPAALFAYVLFYGYAHDLEVLAFSILCVLAVAKL